jgi:Zn-dependent M28 family amino/carboxypeptidase
MLRYLLPAAFLLIAASSPEERGKIWLNDVAILAADDMEGRLTGSPGYDRAAAYVVGRFKKLGLKPAGSNGFLQPVAFEQQTVLSEQSEAILLGDGQAAPLIVGKDMIIGAGTAPRPARVEAPLVFIGYGLHMPEAGHDDLAGVDLKGKIAVFTTGGPANVSAALKSHARGERAKYLAERGALGGIEVRTPKAVEIPWARQMLIARQPGMYLADPALRHVQGDWFAATFDPAQGERLFARSGQSFADVAALADASKPLAGFALGQSLRATIATKIQPLMSANIVAKLPGRDRKLAPEHVVISGHLDGLGTDPTLPGDKIYNGAIDNATGVASLIDIAASYKAKRVRPKRSILFVVVTAEEKGLLGSHYFANRPTVPKNSIVANINYDMPYALWPLTSMLALGEGESTLGADARAVAASMGLPMAVDPLPDRNTFTRSDQYSFIRAGIPSLFPKFGLAPGSPDLEVDRAWRAQHYHAPSDDMNQPIRVEDSIRFDDFVGTLALRIANAPERPTWLPNSFFRRFAAGQ